MPLQWTGERAIPKLMKQGNNPEHQANLDRILSDHITRYNFARKYCRNKKVLDAACGSGYGSEILAEVATFVYGVDVSKESIEYANEHYKKPGMDFFVYDLDSKDIDNGHNPFASRRFETIVCFETIEHLKNPNKFLNHIREMCNMFVFSIPINSLGEFHRHIYTVDDVKDLINPLYSRVMYFSQEGKNIVPLVGQKDVNYVVGIAYHE